MHLTGLCAELKHSVLTKRISSDEVMAPQGVMFLTSPQRLESGFFYIISPGLLESVLPQCSSSGAATVFSTGAAPMHLAFQTKINLITVDCDLFELHNEIEKIISRERQGQEIDAERLRQKFSKIIDSPYLDATDLKNMCNSFPKRLKSYYCIIYIETPRMTGKAMRDQQMRHELEKLFPDDNITIYDSDNVVIHSFDSFSYPPKLPEPEFSRLMDKYGAYAGVSNGMRRPPEMKILYFLARKALEVGKSLFPDGRRIFHYSECMLPNIIALASATFRSQTGSDDIVLLGTPALVNVMKYDPDGKHRLIDTMLRYILSGQSISRTAEVMGMHRNTVQNKLNTICSIIGDDFMRDGDLQCELLMSHYILQYYRNILHKEIVLSPRVESGGADM